MNNYSVREVVEQAVQTEKLGYDFYQHMTKKFENDSKLKELFESLATKEKHHEKVFSDLLAKVKDQGIENPEEFSAYLRSIVESEFFLGKNKSLPSLEHLTTVTDAVKFAIGFERETLLYFYSLKDIVKEKEIVNEIIEEEKSHVRWLTEYMKGL
jgi:rubrerythrin